MKNKLFKNFIDFKLVALFLPSFLAAPYAQAADQCRALFLTGAANVGQAITSTLVERALLATPRKPLLEAQDQLLKEIDEIKSTQPALAQKTMQAREAKRKGQSLRIDLSPIPSHMEYFLEGTYKRIVGDRGLSQPFMTIKAADENSLYIHHEGDKYPMIVRWTESVSTPQMPKSIRQGDYVYQVLELPLNFKNKTELQQLAPKYINSLISGSAVNKYIDPRGSRVMRLASLLHDGGLIFDRPTQAESKELTTLLNSDINLRKRISSLLFVAPTASGKTRVLGDRITDKVIQSKGSNKKLTILMTKTPDLTGELARNIGDQVLTAVGTKNVRIIQWGGELSENMNLNQLLNFVDNSPVPVILVTSYPTIASRANSMGEKEALVKRANGLMIDEAHNAGGTTFEQIMSAAKSQALKDRNGSTPLQALDIFGVTASPITREQRTVELFDHAFWAGVDSPKVWAKKVASGQATQAKHAVLEWVRVIKQYNTARDRGEINAGDPIFYKPEERGFDFTTIFKRGETGTQSSVHIERLKQIWPDIANMIDGHGPGVIHTYPRDAEIVAETLSQLTGRNYVSLQKLNPTERAQVYVAFRDQTPYQGRNIDAIVGTIREGLDFPQAGWYLSFKKYVKFPENVQGPGRVVRLAHNKLSPVIMFFGAEIHKIAYKDVQELVMTKLGRLPGKLQESRLYTGARKLAEGDSVGKAIDNLNVSVEALMRIRGDISKQMGGRDNLDPQRVAQMQAVLAEIRMSGSNREIAESIRQLVFEVNSYSFFKGTLKETWSYADKLLAQAKKPAGSAMNRTLTPADIEILNNPTQMENLKHFRSLYSALGVIPRALLENMELRPVNVTETAKAINIFIERNQALPWSPFADAKSSLKSLTEMAISVSPEGLWRNLSPKAQSLLSSLVEARSQVTLEQNINNFVKENGKLPEPGYKLIERSDITAYDRMAVRLGEELITKVKEGTLEVEMLSPETLKAIDQSTIYQDLIMDVSTSLIRGKGDIEAALGTYAARLKDEGLLNYENLMMTGDFKVLKTIKAIAEADRRQDSNSRMFVEMFEVILE